MAVPERQKQSGLHRLIIPPPMLAPPASATTARIDTDRRKIIMAAKPPDFPAEWAVQGSNLRPWD
jgi:hypothetical protein